MILRVNHLGQLSGNSMKTKLLFILLICLIVNFIQSCKSDDDILHDYVIYNQIGAQLVEHYHYLFYQPFVNCDKRERYIDTTQFHIAMRVISSYGIDTSKYDISETEINILDDSLLTYEFKGDPIIKGVNLEPKLFNTGKNVAIVKYSDYEKYLEKADTLGSGVDRIFKYVFFNLSRIYFDTEENSAYFIVGYQAAPLMGSTDRIEIKKINGAWLIVDCKNIRVS